jgi:hypothetical protein
LALAAGAAVAAEHARSGRVAALTTRTPTLPVFTAAAARPARAGPTAISSATAECVISAECTLRHGQGSGVEHGATERISAVSTLPAISSDMAGEASVPAGAPIASPGIDVGCSAGAAVASLSTGACESS